uniref:Uncharacterized protein n=1 Tax=Anopheles atroparvus TaxID=41427 RepID=A0A182ISA9_ANOAO
MCDGFRRCDRATPTQEKSEALFFVAVAENGNCIRNATAYDPPRIIVPCCLALMVALVTCEGTAQDTKAEETQVEAKESQNVEKRGLHSSFGDFGHDFGGHDEHHHEHIKTVTIEKKVPVPYTVEKHVPYTVEKKVPYEVKVPIPQPYIVEKKVPVHYKEVKVPYTVEKAVPYEVKVPIDRPYPVYKEVKFSVEKEVPYPVKVPVHVPVHVHKEEHHEHHDHSYEHHDLH